MDLDPDDNRRQYDFRPLPDRLERLSRRTQALDGRVERLVDRRRQTTEIPRTPQVPEGSEAEETAEDSDDGYDGSILRGRVAPAYVGPDFARRDSIPVFTTASSATLLTPTIITSRAVSPFLPRSPCPAPTSPLRHQQIETRRESRTSRSRSSSSSEDSDETREEEDRRFLMYLSTKRREEVPWETGRKSPSQLRSQLEMGQADRPGARSTNRDYDLGQDGPMRGTSAEGRGEQAKFTPSAWTHRSAEEGMGREEEDVQAGRPTTKYMNEEDGGQRYRDRVNFN